MRPEEASVRVAQPALDLAAVAAIAAAMAAAGDQYELEYVPVPANSPWRAAGRSVETFDAYDAARRDRMRRRGRAQ